MSFFLQKPVGKMNVAGADAAAAAAAGDGVVRRMTQFAQKAKRENRCRICVNLSGGQGHKEKKNIISKVKSCCGCCGEYVCPKHTVILCNTCSTLFVPK